MEAPGDGWAPDQVKSVDEALTILINKNISELTNEKPPQPKRQVNISESVRDELNEKVNHLTPKEYESAIMGYLKSYRIDGQKGYDPKTFINKIKQKVLNLINQQKKSIKVKFILTCKLIKESLLTDRIDETSRFFHSLVEMIDESTDLSNLFDTMTNHILLEFERFIFNGYGWKFNHVEYFDIYIDPFDPLSGSSYIPLPSKLATKKAIINVKNENDNECFKWAVTSAVFPKEKNAQRLTKQMRENSNNFDWSGMKFPVSLQDIVKFEKQNPYVINVCGYDGEVYPLRISKKRKCEVIVLLLISNDETNHYCWIKDVDKLLSSQVDNNKHKRKFCHRCFNSFYSKASLEKHEEYCNSYEEVKIDMPKDEDGNPKYIKFNNYNRKMRVPFVVYADFESFPEKIHTCSPDESKSFTKQYQKHKASGFCYLIKCFDDNIFSPKLEKYTVESPDDDIPQIFVDKLEKDIREIYDKIKFNKLKYHKKVKKTEQDENNYENATHCHICEGELREDKVLDHCHLTGKYRGAAHNECNLNYKIPKFFPVIFHNLSGYDAHLFIKNLSTSKGKINCIASNEENYISFTKQIVVDTFTKEGKQHDVKRDIRFIDSFRFMATSLDSLVDNLTKCGKCDVCRGVLSGSKCLSPKDKNISETKKCFRDKTNMMLRKGVFPYDWFDGFDKLNETQLPPKDAFYSKLNDEYITEDNYQHAKKVWETFNMKTMREYHDLYLKSDVLLLADVFENFRDVCQKNYNLDPT